jgi:hypothetical protein
MISPREALKSLQRYLPCDKIESLAILFSTSFQRKNINFHLLTFVTFF